MAISYQQTDSAGACALDLSSNTTGNANKLASDGGTAGSETISPSLNGSLTNLLMAQFEIVPESGTTWGAGTWTVRLNVTSANMNLTVDNIFVHKVSSICGSSVQLGTIAPALSLGSTGVKSSDISCSSFSPSAGDKIRITYRGSNSSMNAASYSYTPSQLIDTPFDPPVVERVPRFTSYPQLLAH